jgi:hypothetical protein
LSAIFSSGFRPDRDYRNFSAFSNTDCNLLWAISLVMLAYSDKPFGADQFYGDFNSWERTKAWFAGLEQDLGNITSSISAIVGTTDVFILFRDNPTFFPTITSPKAGKQPYAVSRPLRRNSTHFMVQRVFTIRWTAQSGNPPAQP